MKCQTLDALTACVCVGMQLQFHSTPSLLKKQHYDKNEPRNLNKYRKCDTLDFEIDLINADKASMCHESTKHEIITQDPVIKTDSLQALSRHMIIVPLTFQIWVSATPQSRNPSQTF